MNQVPATLLNLLGIQPPSRIPPKIEGIPNTLRSNHLIFAIFDNFGLLECTYYQPKFLIGKSEAILMLETENPYTPNVLREVIHGNPDADFNLLTFMAEHGRKVTMIARPEDLEGVKGVETRPSDSDNRTYIETVKILNRTDFLWIHFIDFETLYKQYSFRPPKEITQKLISRTDKWLKVLHKQATPGTLMAVLGTHGREQVPEIEYEGKYADWKRANLPICILIKK
jgi:phosphopentomutase